MVYPTDEETFPTRDTPEWIKEGHLNSIQTFLKRIQDFLGYGGRLHDEKGLVNPVGVIIAYGGITAPSGWLMCDGREYDRTNELYADLYAVIGIRFGERVAGMFNVPDLRGYFLRGLENVPSDCFVPANVNTATDEIYIDNEQFNRTCMPIRFTTSNTLPAPLVINTTYYVIMKANHTIQVATSRVNALAGTAIDITTQGVGESCVVSYLEVDRGSRLKLTKGGNEGMYVGSYQDDEFKSHTHNIAYDNSPSGGGVADAFMVSNAKDGFHPVFCSSSGGTESRPKNVNVNYIIKR